MGGVYFGTIGQRQAELQMNHLQYAVEYLNRLEGKESKLSIEEMEWASNLISWDSLQTAVLYRACIEVVRLVEEATRQFRSPQGGVKTP